MRPVALHETKDLLIILNEVAVLLLEAEEPVENGVAQLPPGPGVVRPVDDGRVELKERAADRRVGPLLEEAFDTRVVLGRDHHADADLEMPVIVDVLLEPVVLVGRTAQLRVGLPDAVHGNVEVDVGPVRQGDGAVGGNEVRDEPATEAIDELPPEHGLAPDPGALVKGKALFGFPVKELDPLLVGEFVLVSLVREVAVFALEVAAMGDVDAADIVVRVAHHAELEDVARARDGARQRPAEKLGRHLVHARLSLVKRDVLGRVDRVLCRVGGLLVLDRADTRLLFQDSLHRWLDHT